MNQHLLVRFFADGLLPVIALIGAYAVLFKVSSKAGRAKSYARIIMAGLTALLLAKITASIWQPDAARPFILLGVKPEAAYLDNLGFPSDHALFSAAVTLAVWFETRAKKLAVLLGFLTILVCIGRVVALVHTPLDVVGGVAFALFGALWYVTAEPARATSKKPKKATV